MNRDANRHPWRNACARTIGSREKTGQLVCYRNMGRAPVAITGHRTIETPHVANRNRPCRSPQCCLRSSPACRSRGRQPGRPGQQGRGRRDARRRAETRHFDAGGVQEIDARGEVADVRRPPLQGQSGIHTAKVFALLGIAEPLKPRTVLLPGAPQEPEAGGRRRVRYRTRPDQRDPGGQRRDSGGLVSVCAAAVAHLLRGNLAEGGCGGAAGFDIPHQRP